MVWRAAGMYYVSVPHLVILLIDPRRSNERLCSRENLPTGLRLFCIWYNLRNNTSSKSRTLRSRVVNHDITTKTSSSYWKFSNWSHWLMSRSTWTVVIRCYNRPNRLLEIVKITMIQSITWLLFFGRQWLILCLQYNVLLLYIWPFSYRSKILFNSVHMPYPNLFDFGLHEG